MIDKIIIVLVLYIVLLLFDLPRLKKNEKRVTYIYSIMIVITFYLSADFIFEAEWPNIRGLINVIFLGPAELVADYLMGK
ncbi:hypothetical protein [Halalkalibacter lacteus]|uniref:hypothetical protein n=1 Tax=Halalkalibacter lacteus TaxID=3090663 RepID=UPI002FCB6075